jgi:surfactin family lipopeptide synthetase A
MSAVVDIISKLERLNIKVRLKGDDLELEGGDDQMSLDVLEEIRRNKEGLKIFLEQSDGIGAGNITVVTPRDHYILTHGQRRLWILDQLDSSAVAYTVSSCYEISGDVDLDVLEESFNAMIGRHEILRTTFDSEDGVPYQKVCRQPHRLRITYTDLRGSSDISEKVKECIQDQTGRSFNLREWPLMRVQVIHMEESRYVFLLTMHHIISDAWSMEVMLGEVVGYYNHYTDRSHRAPGSLAIQYKDYAYWQESLLSGHRLTRLESYWKDHLSGSPSGVTFPCQHARPKVKSYRGSSIFFELDEATTGKIRSRMLSEGVSLFTFLLSSVKALVYKYTGCQDQTIGTTVAGRNHKDLEDQIGFYVNTLALRTVFSGADDFRSLLQKVSRSVLGGFAHQDYPFDKVVEALQVKRDLSHSPLFDVLVELVPMQMLTGEGPQIKGLSLQGYDSGFTVSQYDVSFKFGEGSGRVSCALEYNEDLYSREWAHQLIAHYKGLLDVIVNEVSVALDRIDYMGVEEERRLLAHYGRGSSVELNGLLPDLLQASFDAHGDAISLRHEGRSVTYSELDVLSNKLSHHLRRAYGVSSNVRVGVMMSRSVELVVSLLGIVKAGGTFVSIDPYYPKSRKEYIVKDAGIDLLLTDSGQLLELDYYTGRLMAVDVELFGLAGPSDALRVDVEGKDLVYVLYTSGSTGNPKGVCVTHSNLSNYLQWANSYYYSNKAHYATGLLTSLSFDLTMTSVFSPLLRGDTLHIFGEHEVSQLLGDAFRAGSGIKALKLTPSHVNVLKELDLFSSDVESVILGGETLSEDQVKVLKGLNGNMRIYNEYGPTEGTIGCTVEEVSDGDVSSIGKPIWNTRIYILDQDQRLQPEGVLGEICIGGYGVTEGYLNQDGLTGEKYKDNRYGEEGYERIYRTGDLGYWRNDGCLIFKGRKDRQVKLQGYRIELDEIEKVLTSYAGIDQGVVSVLEKGTDRILVGYYSSKTGVNQESLRSYLSGHLPSYMVPQHYHDVGDFVLNTHGKIDRSKLPDIETGTVSSVGYQAAGNAIEARLVQIWEEVLGKHGIGVGDNFFVLGGDSIKSIRVVSLYNKVSEHKIEVKDLFAYQDIASLGGYIASAGNCGDDELRMLCESELSALKDRILSDITMRSQLPPDWEDFYPMSDIVKGMIFHNLMSKGYGVYHDQFYHQLTDRSFDFSLFKYAFGLLSCKHEILRSSFHLNDYGLPLQIVHKGSLSINMTYEDIGDQSEGEQREYLEKYLQSDRAEGFDLKQVGLWRIRVFRLSDSSYGVMWIFHHAIIDGWSNASLMTELSNTYYRLKADRSYAPPSIKARYKDYILEELMMKKRNTAVSYWQEYLSGYERTVLPLGKSAKGYQHDYSVLSHTLDLEEGLNAGLQMLSWRYKTSIKNICLSAFCYLLKVTSQSDDLTLGLVSHLRPEIEDGDKLIGCFLNSIPFRIRLDDVEKGGSLVDKVSRQSDSLKQYDKLSFMEIVKVLGEDSQGENVMYDILYNYVDFHIYDQTHEETIVSKGLVESFENTNTYFDCNVLNTDGRVRIRFNYLSSLYSSEEMDRVGGYYERILELMISDPEGELGVESIVGESEMKRLVDTYNATEWPYPTRKTLVSLFEETASRCADEIVITASDKSLSFSELNRRCNQLSHYLKYRCGVQEGELVGVLQDRSEDMVISLMGILKAGAGYVPLDPDYPEDRITYTLDDVSAKVVMVDTVVQKARLRDSGLRVVCLEEEWALIRQECSDVAAGTCNASSIAYVIYTSGSTGRPKGVMIEHGGVVNRLLWMWCEYGYSGADVVFQKTPYVFDVSVWELFMPLCFGCRQVLCAREVIYDPSKLMDHISRHRITSLHFVPSMLNVFIDAIQDDDRIRLASLRHTVASGEALLPEVVKAYYNKLDVPLHNLYGPTEATVEVTYYQTSMHDVVVPIGKPIWNTQVYILDKSSRVLPQGALGEIHLSGAGLSRGYVNKVELTNEKFIDNPFHGGKMYKTGDIGRWLPDGNIEYQGRRDAQLKIKGHRIELGEIENVVLRHPDIREAQVLSVKEGNDTYLVLYYEENRVVAEAELGKYLRSYLPSYMIPTYYIAMAEMPRTATGKVDRNKLPKIFDRQHLGLDQYVAPASELEQQLTSIWQEVLRREKIGVTDNLFKIGGNSIKGIQILSRIQDEFDVKIEIRQLFTQPTIAALASEIEPVLWIKQGSMAEAETHELIL